MGWLFSFNFIYSAAEFTVPLALLVESALRIENTATLAVVRFLITNLDRVTVVLQHKGDLEHISVNASTVLLLLAG